jgi:hypothetical protein
MILVGRKEERNGRDRNKGKEGKGREERKEKKEVIFKVTIFD